MIRQAFRDPKVFWAYIGTKAAVIVIAAIATWPLARLIGSKAWIGFGVFGGLMAVITLAVLFGGSVAERGKDQASRSDAATDNGAPADPDLVVELPVEDSIDLHSFPPRDVPDVVEAYLEAAAKKDFAEVRLIHGRGIGVQRDRVQKLLARHPLVSGFHDAPPDRGGWGATVVYLERKA